MDCEVGPWGPWGACSAACGGTQGRVRPAITLSNYGGAACPALAEQRECGGDECASAQATGATGAPVATLGLDGCGVCWPGTSGDCRGPNGLCYEYSDAATTSCPSGTSHCPATLMDHHADSVRFIMSLPGVALGDLRTVHKNGLTIAVATLLGVLPSQVLTETTASLASSAAPDAVAVHMRVLVPEVAPYALPSLDTVFTGVKQVMAGGNALQRAALVNALLSNGLASPQAQVEEVWLLTDLDTSTSGGSLAGQEASGQEGQGASADSPIPLSTPAIAAAAVGVLLVGVAAAVIVRSHKARSTPPSPSAPYVRVHSRSLQFNGATPSASVSGQYFRNSSLSSNSSVASHSNFSALSTPRVMQQLHGFRLPAETQTGATKLVLEDVTASPLDDIVIDGGSRRGSGLSGVRPASRMTQSSYHTRRASWSSSSSDSSDSSDGSTSSDSSDSSDVSSAGVGHSSALRRGRGEPSLPGSTPDLSKAGASFFKDELAK